MVLKRQAANGVGQGGLDWKTAVDMALPAFSVEALKDSGQALIAACNARVAVASCRVEASLPKTWPQHPPARCGPGCQAVAVHDEA